MYNPEQIKQFEQQNIERNNKRQSEFADSIWSDQMYLQELEKYKSNPWYDEAVLMNNPYLRSKQADFVTDPITSLFNWDAAATKYYGGMRSDAMTWLAEQNDKLYQQYYNSPSQAAARESVAGINPDLANNIGPGEAAENDNRQEPSFTNGPTEVGEKLASFGLQFFGSVLSFGSQIQNLNAGSANIVASELANDNYAMDLVAKQIASAIPVGSLNSAKDVDAIDIPGVVKSANYDLNRFSRPTKKILKNWYSKLSDGDSMAVESIRSELRKRIVSNNQTSAQIMSSPYYSNDLNDWISRVGKAYTTFIAKIESNEAKIAALESSSRLQVASDKDYQDTYKSSLMSGVEASDVSNKSTIEANKLREQENEAWNELMHVVSGDKNQRKWYNTIGMVLMMALKTQMSQPFHFGSSSSTSINKYGTSESSSFHF